jgi:hypothetical protein
MQHFLVEAESSRRQSPGFVQPSPFPDDTKRDFIDPRGRENSRALVVSERTSENLLLKNPE